jgi:predicted nucleotidyltransferase
LNEPLRLAVREHPYPLLFATVSGAHLYGFPSPDSDYDLRGVHILPAEEVIGLFPKRETVELSRKESIELDLVTHDVHKFFGLLLKANGYVLEQLYSPLIVHTTPEHEELKWIAKSCITRHHAHHYFGFAENQWRLFLKEEPPRVKPLLYVFRVLLTGIHLMRTGVVEANLNRLNEEYQLAYIQELIDRKTRGPERQRLEQAEVAFYSIEYERFRKRLEDEANQTRLPESQTAKAALNDLLLRVRLRTVGVEKEAGTQCPVCRLPQAFPEPGGYDICPQCGREDDGAQRLDPKLAGGANKVSLLQASALWKQREVPR